MKRFGILAACVLACAMLLACQQQAAKPGAEEKTTLTTEKDKVSYAIGMNIGSQLKMQPLDLDPTVLAKGLTDVLNNGKTLLTEDESRDVLAEFQKKMMEQQMNEAKAKSEANAKAGEDFLAKNKAREGVKTTDSGLQYEVIVAGEGPKPSANATVTVDYVGTLTNGTEFDSSIRRGKPATFNLENVIPGWSEGLQLMPLGSKYKLYIPSSLAYGERQVGPQIGPNSVLVFEVELKEIEGVGNATAKPKE